MSDLIERDHVIAALGRHLGGRAVVPDYVAKLYDDLRAIPAATVTGTKPSIDWSHVAPEFNWLARDNGGSAWLHTTRPTSDGGGWYSPSYHKAAGFVSCTPGTCDWQESLVMRPGHVEASR